MAVLLIVLALSQNLPISNAAAPVTFTPTVIPLSDTEIANPWRGGYPGGEIKPANWPATDLYYRFDWRSLEPSQGVYNWSYFDSMLAEAKASGGKFGFRIMAANSLLRNVSSVPNYLISMMPHGFWFTYPGNSWQTYAPDWNDPDLLNRYQALLTAINNRYGNDPRLGWVEVGLFGDFSEWHTWQYPYNGTPYAPSPNGQAADMTQANLRATIAMHANTFPNKLIIMPADERDMIPWWSAQYPNMGFRRDCLGSPYFFNSEWAEHHNHIKNRWQVAPFITESCTMSSGSGYFARAKNQVVDYHVAMVSGHNMDDYEDLTAQEQADLRTMYKSTGYRFILDKLTVPGTVKVGEQFSITTEWKNIGVTPAYNSWQVKVQLLDSGGNTAWSGTSSRNLRTLQPTDSSSSTTTDYFALPTTLAAGNYTVAVRIDDPQAYYAPLKLANTGRKADGSYHLGTIAVAKNDGKPAPAPAPGTTTPGTATPGSPQESTSDPAGIPPAPSNQGLTLEEVKDNGEDAKPNPQGGYSIVDGKASFKGTATPGSQITVEIHSDPIILTTTAGSDRTWSVATPETLPIGTHTVYISATLGDKTESLEPFTIDVTGKLVELGAVQVPLRNIWIISVSVCAVLIMAVAGFLLRDRIRTRFFTALARFGYRQKINVPVAPYQNFEPTPIATNNPFIDPETKAFSSSYAISNHVTTNTDDESNFSKL